MGTYWVEPDAAGSARLSPLRGLYSDEPYVGLKLQKSNSSSVTLVDSGLSQNLFLGIFSVGYVYIPVRGNPFPCYGTTSGGQCIMLQSPMGSEKYMRMNIIH